MSLLVAETTLLSRSERRRPRHFRGAKGDERGFRRAKGDNYFFGRRDRARAGTMRLIEQALFSSIENGDGYQVVARSPGVCPSDVRELCAWTDAGFDPRPERRGGEFQFSSAAERILLYLADRSGKPR